VEVLEHAISVIVLGILRAHARMRMTEAAAVRTVVTSATNATSPGISLAIAMRIKIGATVVAALVTSRGSARIPAAVEVDVTEAVMEEGRLATLASRRDIWLGIARIRAVVRRGMMEEAAGRFRHLATIATRRVIWPGIARTRAEAAAAAAEEVAA